MKRPALLLLALAALLAPGCKTPVKVMDDLALQQFERRVDYRKTEGLLEMWSDLGVESELFRGDTETRLTRQNLDPAPPLPGFVIYLATSNLRREFQYLVFRREPTGALRFLGVAEVTRQISGEPSARLENRDGKAVLVVTHKLGADSYDLTGPDLKKL